MIWVKLFLQMERELNVSVCLEPKIFIIFHQPNLEHVSLASSIINCILGNINFLSKGI